MGSDPPAPVGVPPPEAEPSPALREPDSTDRPVRTAPAGRRRHWAVTLAVGIAAIIFLVAAVGAGRPGARRTDQEADRGGTIRRGRFGEASRWQRWPAGQIFPAGLPYTTNLLTDETARRAGIAPGYGCAAAVDAALAALTRRYGCRAALRASYLDQPGGVVCTLGVLAFPDPRAAAKFFGHYSAGRSPVRGLHALALPGTPAAAFADAARQAASASLYGPYVVLTVAGYADGRPAAATGERRPSAFAPATQFATEIGTPLAQPETVRCATRQWSC